MEANAVTTKPNRQSKVRLGGLGDIASKKKEKMYKNND